MYLFLSALFNTFQCYIMQFALKLINLIGARDVTSVMYDRVPESSAMLLTQKRVHIMVTTEWWGKNGVLFLLGQT